MVSSRLVLFLDSRLILLDLLEDTSTHKDRSGLLPDTKFTHPQVPVLSTAALQEREEHVLSISAFHFGMSHLEIISTPIWAGIQG